MLSNNNIRVLVTGVTGYVGSHLVPRLLDKGYCVRVLVRDLQHLHGKAWRSEVEIVVGDALKPHTLPAALEQVDYIYYLIHSMLNVVDYSAGDSKAAENVGNVAKTARVKRIIYLGGLGNPDSNLSTHLRSRHATGEKLRASGVSLTEFRAGIIIGSGSASFEMIRYLTERLPIIITPNWVYTQGQPIAIGDILDYLVLSLSNEESAGKILEIGGPDILSYAEMMLVYAKVRNIKRYLYPLPLLTPLLTSKVGWITPVPTEIARALIEGLKNEVVVREPLAESVFPRIKPLNYLRAVELAIDDLKPDQFEEFQKLTPSEVEFEGAFEKHHNLQGMIMDIRHRKVKASPEHVFRTITSLGGQNGWLFANWLWQLRGMIDQIVGGVGLRRGRKHPTQIRVGDPLDFYRVEVINPNLMLRLKGEMKVPGDAWMEFSVQPLGKDTTLLTQTAYFVPKGLLGHIYWYLLFPIHKVVFSGLIRHLALKSTH